MSCFTTAADTYGALAVAWILPTADAAERALCASAHSFRPLTWAAWPVCVSTFFLTADAGDSVRVSTFFGMCVFLLDVFFDREIVGEILVVKKAVGNGVDVVGCGFVGIILIL